jgi:SAM-dependent methyltransferase
MTERAFPAAMAQLTDDEWFRLIVRSLNERRLEDCDFPGFPSADCQRATIGSSGEQALSEGFQFYRVVKRYAAELGCPLRSSSRVLDFGCGWGRMLRFFLKEVPESHLYGVDVTSSFIDICTQLVGHANYKAIEPQPPVGFDTATFDVVYAYSVFSHLSESVANLWIREFSRILKPGGVFIATTQGRTFFEFCRSFRDREQFDHAWHRSLAMSFPDIEDALARYDRGEFLYAPTGGGQLLPATFYGQAAIPQKYVEREWTGSFRLCDFIDDRKFLPQALIVMQKRRDSETDAVACDDDRNSGRTLA